MEYEPKTALTVKEKPRGGRSEETQCWRSCKLKYCVLFQTSQVKKKYEKLERVSEWPGALRTMFENQVMELDLLSQ